MMSSAVFSFDDKDINAAMAAVEAFGGIHEKDHLGYTPLSIAVYEKRHDLVVRLLELGANIEDCDNTGVTPLLLAARYSTKKIVNELLIRGANINAVSHIGMTVLMFAALSKCKHQKEIIWSLIEAGADVNAVDREGDDFLSLLPDSKSRILRYLLVQSKKHSIPWDLNADRVVGLITKHDRVKIALMLLSFGADANGVDGDGLTPFLALAQSQSLSEKNYKKYVTPWVAAGADVLAVNDQGDDALMLRKAAGLPMCPYFEHEVLFTRSHQRREALTQLVSDKLSADPRPKSPKF